DPRAGAALGLVLATLLGSFSGRPRLSKHFLGGRLATGYVELIRNVPLLLQLLFWYNAVLRVLPEFAASLVLPGGVLLNNRGLFLPRPLFADGTQILAVSAALLLAVVFNPLTKRGTGFWGAAGVRAAFTLLIAAALPVAIFFVSGAPLAFDYPL